MSEPRWFLLTRHGQVLVCLATGSNLRVRDIAQEVGLTERAVQTVLADLEAAGFLKRERVGRRTSYTLIEDVPLRHPLLRQHTLGELLSIFKP